MSCLAFLGNMRTVSRKTLGARCNISNAGNIITIDGVSSININVDTDANLSIDTSNGAVSVHLSKIDTKSDK